MTIIYALAGAVAGIILGILIGRYLFQTIFKKEKETAEREAKNILKDAESRAESAKKDKLLEAKEEILRLKSEHEREANERNRKLLDAENRIKQKEQGVGQKEQAIGQKEQALNQKMESLQRKEQETETVKVTLQQQIDLLDKRRQELDKIEEENIKRLEKIAGLTAAEAKAQLIETLKKQAEADAMALEKQMVDDAKQRANKEARKIIIQTIQRVAAEQAIENSVNVFPLDSDDVKGQIIGREGRNIRALEAACGVELIVDDTPEAIVISSFDAVRRELARLSLQRLLTDGRIHPGRIEEIVEKTRKQLEDHIVEIGERTVIELGITGLAPELVKYVGRMRFRSSYGQNLLQHSREVAELCSIMAAELGLNAKLAKRAGLLHDIGKVLEEESDLSHALAGAKIAERNKEHPAVINAIGAHHDEMEMTFNISPIIQACDAISGSRPGARREIMEHYIKRIKDLEALALTYQGVEKAYAIQAGRELRVIVEAEKITDAQADTMSFAMAKKIETEMTYPGQVKVTVIREKRAVNFAK